MGPNNEYTKEDVEKWIDEVGTKLFEIDRAIEQGIETDKKIFFHPGIAKGAWEYKKDLDFIEDEILKSNIAYSLMILDVYDWLLRRFGIDFLLRQLVIKNAITVYGNIIDALVRYIALKLEGGNSNIGTKKALSILCDYEIISPSLKTNFLDKIWAIRNKQHLISLQERELDKYTDEDYQSAVKIWVEFKDMVREAKKDEKF